MDDAVGVHDRVGQIIGVAVTSFVTLPGVRRVGLALSEGGGRRLRFTASDRDNSRSVDWCHIDAYDDVPLTTVLRTGGPVFSTLEDLEGRFAAFVEHQRRRGTAAIAAVPLPGSGSPMGAVILFYDSVQSFDAAQRSELKAAAARLTVELRSAQAVTPRDIPALAELPVQPGSLVADVVVNDDPRSGSSVRRWARARLRGWGLDDDHVDSAVLCLSELVTNALIHTGSGCEVRLVFDLGLLTVTVRDRGAALRVLEDEPPRDPLRVHGRGLKLVDALSSRWGSALDSGGTTVWFALETSANARARLEDRASAAVH